MTNLAVRVIGADRPGITADLMSTLAALEADLEDLEQVLVRQRLILAAVVATDRPDSVRRELAAFGARHGLSVQLDEVADAGTQPAETQIVTVLAPTITAAALEIITDTLGSLGANIDRIVRLARYPVYCYELRVSGADAEGIRSAVTAAGAAARVDVAVQRETLGRRAMRLVAFDVDSTLIQGELIDEVAKEAGCGAEVGALTVAAMAGELDFESALRARVALLKGLDVSVLMRIAAEVPFTPGARTLVATLKRLGFDVVAFSGGFSMMTNIVGERLGLDATHANDLEVIDGRLTGWSTGPERANCWPSWPAGPAYRWLRRWRWATAPTTWTCWAGRGWESRSMPKRFCEMWPMQPSRCPISTWCCSCWGWAAAMWNANSSPVPTPRRPSNEPMTGSAPVRCSSTGRAIEFR